ncbi:MAG TPA: hypothetical protein VNO30_14980 [Kofleriaceae bacterium]|nr:hypothetical protein [Kofleriaceae bacterium]
MTCVLWLLGVEVLPNLHLAHHHDDHTHAADGTIVALADHDHDDADHDHGDADHDHDHDHADADADHVDADADHDHDDGQLAIDHPSRPHHQASGIAHHATALHRPAAPPLAPAAVARLTWQLVALADAPPRDTFTARPIARGPPTI